jgi:hypothetical protein
MPTTPVPKSLLAWATAAKSAVIVGGVLYLLVAGKISGSVAAGMLAGLGGAWSGVVGMLASVGRANAVAPAGGALAAPGISAAPAATATPVPPTP